MSDWKSMITTELIKHERKKPEGVILPLFSEETYGKEEILAMIQSLLIGQLSMGKNVVALEEAFCKYTGSPFSVMVNSGSSANLLAVSAAFFVHHDKEAKCLRPGSEVLVPAVCWSTSVWPIVQIGLTPVFVDCDPLTLNADLNDVRRKITSKTSGMIAVHVMGNSCEMDELLSICKEHNLVLIEDTCESLGSKYNGQLLGTFGDYGTYSFFISHHMTTGEGGMVTCKTQEQYDLLKSMRAHGWTRSFRDDDKKKLEEQYPDIDPRFLFINTGYNLRPQEINGAMGLVQLAKLDHMNSVRVSNHRGLIAKMQKDSRWKDQFVFPHATKGMTDCIWFGFNCLINPKLGKGKKDLIKFLSYLDGKGVQNRPIISGNFVRQPALKKLGMNIDPLTFPGAEMVNDLGFFTGIHPIVIEEEIMDKIVDIFLSYEF